MSDDQAREMRPETTSEHIARDIREGRFPEQSERQMVPVLASLPHEIQVWRSTDTLDHIGTWATKRYPAEAVTYVPKADAQAAVALVVERAATQADPWDGPVTKNKIVDAQAIAAQQIKARIRALAPADGLAAVEALRATADGYKHAAEGFAAELAASRASETELKTALIWCSGSEDFQDGGYAREGWLKLCAPLIQPAALAPTPPDTWHERRTMLPDGDARAVKARGEP